MFGFNKTSLAPAPREEYLHEVIPNTYHLIPFQVYQVGILHPDTWPVYINPSKTFAFHDGFAKIDRSAEKSCPDQASLALRWAKLKKETTIDEYMDEIKLQYEKKQKKNKKDSFKILSMTPVEDLPHKAYLMESSIRANHSVYRTLGKEESILSLQLTTYCDVTKRLVIASLASTPEDFESKRETYREILFSLTCH